MCVEMSLHSFDQVYVYKQSKLIFQLLPHRYVERNPFCVHYPQKYKLTHITTNPTERAQHFTLSKQWTGGHDSSFVSENKFKTYLTLLTLHFEEACEFQQGV